MCDILDRGKLFFSPANTVRKLMDSVYYRLATCQSCTMRGEKWANEKWANSLVLESSIILQGFKWKTRPHSNRFLSLKGMLAEVKPFNPTKCSKPHFHHSLNANVLAWADKSLKTSHRDRDRMNFGSYWTQASKNQTQPFHLLNQLQMLVKTVVNRAKPPSPTEQPYGAHTDDSDSKQLQ